MKNNLIDYVFDEAQPMIPRMIELQAMIDDRNAYQLAFMNMLKYMYNGVSEAKMEELRDSWYREAMKQLESDKINAGKVC